MSEIETGTPTPPASPEAPAGGPGAGAPVSPPAGYVPQADFDRAESHRRSLQGELDRLRATPPVPPAAGSGGAPAKTPSGFDPEGFRRQLLTDVFGATALAREAEVLRGQFEYADPSLFDADVLPEFGSVEALRTAVEADHNRVKAIVEAKLAAATPAPAGGQPSPLGPGNPAGQTPAGDPTASQLAAMSPSELYVFEQANPGVIDRVLRSTV